MRFRTKLLVCMVWVLALALSIGSSLMIHASFSTALQREKDAALVKYKMLTSSVEVVYTQYAELTELESIFDTVDRLYGSMGLTSISLIEDGAQVYSRGTVFADGSGEPEEGTCQIRRFRAYQTPEQGDYLQVSGWIGAGDSRVMLTMVTDIGGIYDNRDEMLATFRQVFLVTIAVGGLLSWGLAALLTRPVSRVSAAARKMAQGELDTRLCPKGKDEIAQLSRDFDDMAQKLQENIRAMEDTMAAQERFMGSFAHELKTPMTSIIGYADLMRSQKLSEQEAMEAANYIFSEGKRLESLSLKLLDILVTKNETMTMESVEVGKLAASLVTHLRPAYAQQNITLGFRCQPGKWELDPVLMRSVLVNLMDNSRKAMEKGGLIHISVDFPENACRIRVTDNGRGMPEEAVKHITEAFYRVDKSRSREQGGAGLGLTLCSEIVARHGGTLTFRSRPGVGTVATILLKGERQ